MSACETAHHGLRSPSGVAPSPNFFSTVARSLRRRLGVPLWSPTTDDVLPRDPEIPVNAAEARLLGPFPSKGALSARQSVRSPCCPYT